MTRFDHDGSFRSVFSEPRAVKDLMEGFVDRDDALQLDWTTLKQVAARHTTENLKQGESDMIWEVCALGNRGRVRFLLLEFQSQPDWTMALRIWNYFGQLQATLAKRHDCKVGRKLHWVQPIVVYNGEREWGPARDLSDMVKDAPANWEGPCPQLRHEVVDVFRSPALDRDRQNVADAMFRLHKVDSLEAARAEVRWLKGWLSDEDSASLRRMMIAWIIITLVPWRLPGVSVGDTRGLTEWDTLEAAMATWSEQLKAEGLAKGRTEGLAKGRTEGLARGRTEGKAGLLISMARQRFGDAVASTMSALLGSVQTESALDAVGAWLLTCETGDALIAKIRQI